MQERNQLSLLVNSPNIGSLNDTNGTEKDINMAYLAVNYLEANGVQVKVGVVGIDVSSPIEELKKKLDHQSDGYSNGHE